MVSVSRDAVVKTKAEEVAALLGSIVGKLAYLLQPFLILTYWQICFALFAYFFPVTVEQWDTYVRIPWPLFALVCGVVRLWSLEFRKSA